MEEINLDINENELNCSQIVFYAICKKHNKSVTSDMLRMLCAINSGFGIGEICSAIIGSLCALSLFFDENHIKKLRLLFLMDFNEKFGTFNCCELSCGKHSCDDIISFCIQWAEEKLSQY